VLDGKPVDSVLEPAMRQLLDRFGLPTAEFHPIIAGFEVDFRIVDSPIVLECDGWATHGLDKAQLEKDRSATPIWRPSAASSCASRIAASCVAPPGRRSGSGATSSVGPRTCCERPRDQIWAPSPTTSGRDRNQIGIWRKRRPERPGWQGWRPERRR
jgi:hypothetical protein